MKNGANVNHKDKDGKTALNISVEKSFGKIIEILIQNGADTNEKYKDGRTALEIAIGKSK